MLWQREALAHLQDVIQLLEQHQPESNGCLVTVYRLKMDILEAFPIEHYGLGADGKLKHA